MLIAAVRRLTTTLFPVDAVRRRTPGAYTDFVSVTPTLTSLAKAGGCAAKYPAARLETLLAGFVPADAAELLVGLDPADDAAVYRLDDERAIVFTVDFFPPVVDDPRDFGAIAATNALNDVFAMGGLPLLALSIAAFPEELPTEMLGEILAGADEVVRAAGAILAGGHTIRDDEPKYGLAVVGTVHPMGIWPKSGAQAGRCALPDEGARDRARAAGAARRPRARGGARRRRRRDAHAQSRSRRRAAALQSERGHGRDGLRAARPRVRDGVAQRRADRARGCGAPRASRRASSSRATGRAPAETGATATTRGRTSRAPHPTPPRRSRSIRRPRAACSSRFPPTGRRCSSRALPIWASSSIASGASSRARASSCDERESRRADVVKSSRVRRDVSPRRFVQLATRVTVHALGRRHERRGRSPDRFRARLRQLAALRRQALSPRRVGTRRSSSATGWSLSSGSSSRSITGSPRGGSTACRGGCVPWLCVTALGTIAQIPLGGITVLLDLHPVAVMSHFLLALARVAGSVVVAVEGWSHSAASPRAAGPVWLRRAAVIGVAACAVLVVTGTVATASGPALRRGGHSAPRARRA